MSVPLVMKGLIRLSYRKLIDASSRKPWDQTVFEETFQEFFMQAQLYNQARNYQTFQELLDHVPAADQLHYLTSRVAMSYLKQLNQTIPDVLNASGIMSLPFSQFKFEILSAHLENKDSYRIAITFYSEPLTWLDTLGNQLLIAYGDHRLAVQAGDEVATDLIALQPNVSIWSFQPFSATV